MNLAKQFAVFLFSRDVCVKKLVAFVGTLVFSSDCRDFLLTVVFGLGKWLSS